MITTFPSLSIRINEYPAVKEHLLSFGKERLEQSGRKGSRKKTSHQWFETQDCISYWDNFSRQKIIWGGVSENPDFAFDNGQYSIIAPSSFLTGSMLKFLIGILNSKIVRFYLKTIGCNIGKGYRWYNYAIENILIISTSSIVRKDIEICVETITRNVEVTYQTNKINHILYECLELTSNEIDFLKNQ